MAMTPLTWYATLATASLPSIIAVVLTIKHLSGQIIMTTSGPQEAPDTPVVSGSERGEERRHY